MIRILSHPLSSETPCYGGRDDLQIKQVRNIEDGDVCSKYHITLNNHVGTHVDAPGHFIRNGRLISDYEDSDWVFNNVLCIDCSDSIIDLKLTEAILARQLSKSTSVTAILLKTGMEQYRGTELFWSRSVVFPVEISSLITDCFPNLQIIGIDAISVASLLDREAGIAIHRALLSRDIRIIEDMKLTAIHPADKIAGLYVIPHICDQIDATPVTVCADLSV